jgi:hypothetical protein
MQRAWLWAVIGLLLLNTAGVGWLVTSRRSGAGGGSATLIDAQLVQMDKLFRIMTEFHHELETVTGQAAYEDDREKAAGKLALQGQSLAYSLSRLDYEAARKSHSVRDLQAFISGALYSRAGFGGATMDAPTFERFVAAIYDSNFRQIKPSTTVSYANVSGLESLQEQFKVLAQSLIEDIK